jgi:hypothetical protein
MENVNESLQFKVIDEHPSYFDSIKNRSTKAIEYAKEKCKQALIDGSYRQKYCTIPAYNYKWEEISGLDIVENIDPIKFNRFQYRIDTVSKNKYNNSDFNEMNKYEDFYFNNQFYIELFKKVYREYHKEDGWFYTTAYDTIFHITTNEGVKFEVKFSKNFYDLDNQKYLYGLLELFELNY